MKSRSSTERKVKDIKKISRDLHKGMPKGGSHGTKKGDKGYTRKVKHKKDGCGNGQ
jgi:hypothetical protein